LSGMKLSANSTKTASITTLIASRDT